MEPILNLKRQKTISYDLCIICQDSKLGATVVPTEKGRIKLKSSAEQRQNLHDPKFHETTERVLAAFKDECESNSHIAWHRECYQDYAHDQHIERLKSCERPRTTLEETSAAVPASSASANATPLISLRSTSNLVVDWNSCLFCQTKKGKEKLFEIRTFNVSNKILEKAKFVEQIHLRVADVNDLIAAEGRYHSKCYKKFERDIKKAEDAQQDSDLAMIWITQELEYSADRGHVLDLKTVWARYQELAKAADFTIPSSYYTRLATFKEKLLSLVSNFYEFVILKDQEKSDQQTVLLPKKFSHVPLSQWADTQDSPDISDPLIPVLTRENDNEFLSMVHVALKLRSDILSHPTFEGLDVNEDKAIECVPESVYMFVRLLIGGEALLELDPEEEDDPDRKELLKRARVLSICQDLVYNVSDEKKLTPKHVGLGLTLHHESRSKNMVELFHNAGHIIGYKKILQCDTGIAENELKRMDLVTGAVIPGNLQPDVFVQYSTDNIEVKSDKLDGKGIFSGTQLACWQRGPEPPNHLKSIKPSQSTSLKVPNELDEIIPANHIDRTATPKFQNVQKNWFKDPEDEPFSKSFARAKDMSFFMIRHYKDDNEVRNNWTNFNKDFTLTKEHQKTTIGFMPIIQAPAHDLDTMNTVVQRALHVSKTLGQRYVVITVDQALFPLLMEWAKPEYEEILIPRLGGLHIAMNFLKVIGQQMKDSGLENVWTDSQLLGEVAIDKVLAGKCYSKAVRAHKITLQALWQLLLPELSNYLQDKNPYLRNQMVELAQLDDSENVDQLVAMLSSPQFQNEMSSFLASHEEDATFQYWWQYMEMVCILLRFIRADREGIWNLHLESFREMLPYFHRYDHTNYARWGPVYLNEMRQLPMEIEEEFQQGNFVVKETAGTFNQVSP